MLKYKKVTIVFSTYKFLVITSYLPVVRETNEMANEFLMKRSSDNKKTVNVGMQQVHKKDALCGNA